MTSEKEPIIALIPCRAGSERVKNKNTRPFADIEGGLLELKLNQLSRVSEIEKIIVSSNDVFVLDYVRRFGKERDSRCVAVERPDELGHSSTPMSAFIRYSATLEASGVMLMTHVTHPLVTSAVFSELIAKYHQVAAEGNDSLFTATKIHKFLWDENGPYNYDNTVEKWPRSQDIKPIFEINHAAYLMPFQRMREVGDRIGTRPYIYEMSENVAMDIDWEEQFQLLSDIVLAKKARGLNLF